MSDGNASLHERLSNYVMLRRGTVAQTERLSKGIHEKYPEGADTGELDAALRAQKHMLDELQRLLNGEELVRVQKTAAAETIGKEKDRG